jgi:threonine dehydratase
MLRMQVPTRDDIEAAAALIERRVRRTPVIELDVQVDGSAVPVIAKLELMQHTASFKVRGAFHSVLSAPDRPRRLVAASGGNHGLAVAYAGRALGIPASIFLPETAPEVKVDRLRSLGAEVTQVGDTYAVALAESAEAADQPGALSLHAYEGWHTVTGQGTVGRELWEQAELDTVLVAVGGGGLLGGIASWYGQDARLLAVEPEHSSCYHAAVVAGGPVDTTPSGLAADALGASRIGEVGWAAMSGAGVGSILVTADDIREARAWLWREVRIAAEPGGATALAAVLSGAYRPSPAERVGVVICGGNTNPSDLA